VFDRFGREITSLRVSLTSACNMRCAYCVPMEGHARPRGPLLGLDRIEQACRAAVALGVRKVRLTGGEPLLRPGVEDLVGSLSRIDGLAHLAMTTNGTLLADRAGRLRAAGLNSVNVSLDTLDPGRYAELTGGGRIDDALRGIGAALSAGLAVKINMVVLPDTTGEEIQQMRVFAAEIGAGMQLIALFSLDTEKCDSAGFEKPPSCDTCNRIRLTADGCLKPCLHSNDEIPLDFARLGACMEEAIRAKPRRGGVCTNRTMAEIGG
jgi:GTP 3',8-cyclase